MACHETEPPRGDSTVAEVHQDQSSDFGFKNTTSDLVSKETETISDFSEIESDLSSLDTSELCQDLGLNEELSPGSLKYIEPDIPLEKLLNFEGDDSRDILDDSDSSEVLSDIAVESQLKDTITNEYYRSKHMNDACQSDITETQSLQKKLSTSWSEGTSLDTANLTLEEVGHIRSVLVRAYIESLPDGIKKDVITGNVCYQCMKTKFGLFSRSSKCALCTQVVCSKCLAKVSVTPSLVLPRSSGLVSSNNSFTLPRLRSLTTATKPCTSSSLRRNSNSMSSGGDKGSVLSVCVNCREMVVQISKSDETSRKLEISCKTKDRIPE